MQDSSPGSPEGPLVRPMLHLCKALKSSRARADLFERYISHNCCDLCSSVTGKKADAVDIVRLMAISDCSLANFY